MVTKLVLVRHGETKINVKRKLHVASDPEKLTKKGRDQIKITAKYLSNLNPVKVYCSKEKRAGESAEIISKICNVPLLKMNGLEERNWGDFSNKTWEEIKEVLEPMSLEERYNYVPPKGESWREVEERIIKTIDRILKDNQGKVVTVVSHAGTIRILMPYLLKAPKEETFKHDPDNASITIFDYSKGKFKKERINDTSHLKVLE